MSAEPKPLPAWLELVLCVASCAAISGGLWWWAGPVAAVLSAPIWGLLVARPLMAASADLFEHARTRAIGDRNGRHHAVAGMALDVTEAANQPWIGAAALKKLLDHPQERDDVFAARFPGRWRRDERSGALYIRADALAEHLRQAPGRMEPLRLRLLRHVEREILFPHAHRLNDRHTA
jgi:hypothetical protein